MMKIVVNYEQMSFSRNGGWLNCLHAGILNRISVFTDQDQFKFKICCCASRFVNSREVFVKKLKFALLHYFQYAELDVFLTFSYRLILTVGFRYGEIRNTTPSLFLVRPELTLSAPQRCSDILPINPIAQSSFLFEA